MAFKTLTFNGTSTSTFSPKIYVETPPNYQVPEVETESTHIPGRNGDIVVSLGSYKNVKREYEINSGAETVDGFITIAHNIARWLHSSKGTYAQLSDDYDPGRYRLARFTGNISIENIQNKAAKMKVEFDCKPQVFDNPGVDQTIYNNGTITNPYDTIALPTIYFTSPQDDVEITITNADGTIRSMDLDLTEVTGEVYIDCEAMMVYKSTDGGTSVAQNLNSKVTLANNYFLDLGGGVSTFMLNGVSSVKVRPMWWTI